ncbi:MAG: phosphatase PAP2 family protein [Lachnospiraceae bacterium]|nr:phosphatase PAP2 family protein [Lachnospiraceae bacterium]
MLSAFVVWTIMIQTIDVKKVGVNGTEVGFATLNMWFHKLTGVHMPLYTISDWLGIVPILICMIFGVLGLVQLIKRRSLLKVDRDIICLGIYYILVIAGYLLFEMIPINYRPDLIDGRQEASYPSSTTLLVLSVMPTLKFQADRRIEALSIKNAISVFVIVFSLFMVICRIISGVHWLTDIVGSVLLSFGLFMIYIYFVTSAKA